MPNFLGAVSTAVLSGSVTVPSGAEIVLAFWSIDLASNGSTLSSITLGGSGTFNVRENIPTVGASFERNVGCADAIVSSTGSQTLTLTFSSGTAQGPAIFLAFFDDVDTGDYFLDSFAVNEASSTAPSGSVTSEASGAVFGIDARYGSVVTAHSGWTTPTNGTITAFNSQSAKLQYANSPGASSTSFTSPNPNWSAIALISLKGSGGASYSLTADAGSYTLTGQAAGTKFGRKLVAGQGTYTLTGSAASLLEGHVITCAQGSYTLTGSTAYADYAITCASGSYTLSGQAAGTKAARKLAAAQGAYTLTGQDVALLYTTPGAYSLAMGQGTYTLTGQAAALQAARRIVAAQGLYALSGQAAALRLGRKVALAAGSYSLTGQDIAFDAPARLAAAAGSYALTGQAVTLTYAGAPVAAVLSAPPSGRRLQGYGRPANIQRSTR